jgi:hypothetical protein
MWLFPLPDNRGGRTLIEIGKGNFSIFGFISKRMMVYRREHKGKRRE